MPVEPIFTAYKFQFLLASDLQFRSPNTDGFTPADFIAGGPEYTAGEVVTISTDDANFVESEITAIPIRSTVRASHMFEFDVATPGLLEAIDNHTIFGHTIFDIRRDYNQRTYVWNGVTELWNEIASTTSVDSIRIMDGSVLADWPHYVVGGKMYVLHWDYEGIFRTGIGSCVKEGEPIHTSEGLVLVDSILPPTLLLGWKGVRCRQPPPASLVARARSAAASQREPPIRSRNQPGRIERRLEEKTRHSNETWELTKIVTADGSVTVTDNHAIPTDVGDECVRAGELTTRHKVLRVDGRWVRILDLLRTVEGCEVYDLQTRASNYFVGTAGIAINVMHHS